MRAIGYSEDLIDILKWMLTFQECDRPNFKYLFDKIMELHDQRKWFLMNDVSVVKAPKEGSKTDIDM